MNCLHPLGRRRTIIRSAKGSVMECEICGQAQLLDENDNPIGFDPFATQGRSDDE